MVRLVSLFAFACLTLAAASLLNDKTAKQEQDEEKGFEPANRFGDPVGVGAVSFHARFSLN